METLNESKLCLNENLEFCIFNDPLVGWKYPFRSHLFAAVQREQDASFAALWLLNCVSNHSRLTKCFIIAAVLFAKELLEQTTPTRAVHSRHVGVILLWAVKLEGDPGLLTLSWNHHFIFFPKGKKELNVYFMVGKNTPLQSLRRNKIITVTESCSLRDTLCQGRLWWHIKTFLNCRLEYIWAVLTIFYFCQSLFLIAGFWFLFFWLWEMKR